MKVLPVLPSSPRCPAATRIAGACASQQGVVCSIMEQSHEDDPGLGIGAAATGFIHNEATGGRYLNLKSDPSTVTCFCHGDAVPVVSDAEIPGGRASYTYCPVWQAERKRIEEGRATLLTEPEPEPVAAGVQVTDYSTDPSAAVRDLNLLAGE